MPLLRLITISFHKGNPMEVFRVLLQDRIVGFPLHVTRLRLEIDIENDGNPVLEITRIVSDESGFFVTNVENDGLLRITERYDLHVEDDVVIATLRQD